MPVSEPSADRPVAPSRGELDEAELVRRAQLGSAAAFEQLVLARGPHLHRYLVVRLRDAEVLDALQETFTAAWQALPGLKSPSRFWPWLVGIAAHKSADVMRRRLLTGSATGQPPTADEVDLFEIREALAALPEPFRQVLLLRYVLELSEAEVAEALGVRVGTVKSRSARARRALEELLR